MQRWLRDRENEQDFAVAAFIVSPGGIPLVRDERFATPYWKLAGGKSQPGETPEEALVREVFEELGIRLDPKDPYLLHSRDRNNHISYIFRVDLPVTPVIKDRGDEGEMTGMFAPGTILEMSDILPTHRSVIEHSLCDLIAVRVLELEAV